MQSEHKTQIYLSRQQHRRLVRRARLEGRSMAAVVRDAVDRYLHGVSVAASWQEDSLSTLAGVAEGRSDDSASVDDVLYGPRR